MKNKGLGSAALSILCAAPFLITMLLTNPVIGGDEIWQVQAGYRLATGHGYTSTREVEISDISKAPYSFLTGWPIGYSFILAVMMKVGFSLANAINVIRLLIFLTCFLSWNCFFAFFSQANKSKILFSIIITPFIIYFGSSITDLFLVSITPLIIYLLYNELVMKCDPENQSSKKHLLFLGCIFAVIITWKYSSIGFLFGCFILLIYLYRSNYGKLFRKIIWIFTLPIVVFILISSINFLYGGQPNSITTGKVRIYADIMWLIKLPRSIFFETIPIKLLIENVLKRFGILSFYDIITYALTILIILILFYLFRRIKHHTVEQDTMFKLSMIIAGGFIIFLCIISLFYSKENYRSAVVNARFYRPIALLFLFQIFWYAFDIINKKLTGKIHIIFLLILTVSLIGWYSVQIITKEKKYHVKKEHLDSVLEEIHSKNPNIPMVMFATNFHHMTTWEDKIPTYRYPALRLKDGVYFSAPTLVFIGFIDQEENIILNTSANIELRKMIQGMKKAKIDSMSLYWKRFESGQLFPQNVRDKN